MNKKTIITALLALVMGVQMASADIDKSSTAYQLFYQLATGQHNNIVKESGYIVYK